jgi:hypothetical protein
LLVGTYLEATRAVTHHLEVTMKQLTTTPILLATACVALIAFPKCVNGGVKSADTPDRASETKPTRTGSERATLEAPKCPVSLSHVDVSSYPTDQGAVLAFSTTGDALPELRERGWSVAEVYDLVDAEGVDENTPEAWPKPPALTRVEVTEMDNGIHLDIAAVYEEDVEDVQDHLLNLARVMRESGDCPNVLPRT